MGRGPNPGGPSYTVWQEFLGLGLPHSNPVEAALLVTEELQARPIGSVMPAGSLPNPGGGVSL